MSPARSASKAAPPPPPEGGDATTETTSAAPTATSTRSTGTGRAAAPPPLVVADVPLSTTRAHLLTIVVPRVHRVYVASDDNGDGGDGEDGGCGEVIPEVEIKSKKAVGMKGKAGGEASSGRGGSSGPPSAALAPKLSIAAPAATSAGTAGSSSSSSEADSGDGVDPGGADGAGGGAPAAAAASGDDGAATDDAPDDIIGYTEGDDSDSSVSVEHVVTAEEMAAVVKIVPPPPSSEPDDEIVKEEKRGGAVVEAAAEKIKTMFFGVMRRDGMEKRFSEKEAVAAMRDETPNDGGAEVVPNTEIKVEELLRLTFRTLLAEGHLFNAPIYTSITPTSSNDRDGDDWVEVSVMVRAQSIGTALERLERIGVGSSVGTVSIYKAELCRTAYDYRQKEAVGKEESDRESSEGGGGGAGGGGGPDGPSENGAAAGGPDAATARSKTIEAAKAEWKNAASRLRVEQVKEQISEQAAFSFDFLALLTIASLLAGIGLIVDSTVVIVASMLVSPIMGPVMGMTFGSRVNDWTLAKSSAAVEFLALLLAVAIGAAIGLSSSWTESAQHWPTDEMLGRGDTTGLITGIAIAIPSGMGVALSILGNNTASLVGVAISASLLPPAVNAGICWAHAVLIRAGSVANLNDEDFGHIGGISFALTVVNIVCIWLSGMLMFAIKEVAPTKAKSAFWSRDIKIARTVNNNTGSSSREVDLEVIRAGLKSALEKEQKAATTKSTKDGPGAGGAAVAAARWRRKRTLRRAAGPRSAVTFNLAVDPVPLGDIGQIDGRNAKAMGLEELVEPFPVPRAVPAVSLASGSVVGGSAAAPRLIDDVRYVGLEDMAALLGFDDEEDDEETAPRKTGGWSFGWLGR